MDFWSIVKGAPNVSLAYDFVKFVSDPKNMSQLSKYIDYGPVHRDAISLIDSDIAETLPTHPSNMMTAFTTNPRFWADNGAEMDRRFNAWLFQ